MKILMSNLLLILKHNHVLKNSKKIKKYGWVFKVRENKKTTDSNCFKIKIKKIKKLW